LFPTPAATVSASPISLAFISAVHADEGERAERYENDDRVGEELWEQVHEVLANGVMVLVVLHVLGVMLASVIHRDKLVASMFSGAKRAE